MLLGAGQVAQHCAPMGTVGCPRALSLSPGLSNCFLSVSGVLGSGFDNLSLLQCGAPHSFVDMCLCSSS